jgi:hypothetical protein
LDTAPQVNGTPTAAAVAAPRIVIIVFGIITTLLLGLGGDQLLQWALPIMAVPISVFLFYKSMPHYVGFVWWLWFLSPEVRRLVDYHIGWNWQSPVIMTPILASAISVLALPKALKAQNVPPVTPFLLIGFGILYGYAIGVQTVGFPAATFAAINWLVPPMFCLALAGAYEQFIDIRHSIIQTFVWGGMFCGAYGLLQFFFLPLWDAYWMINARMASEGLPVAGFVRIFGPMNSSGPFASTMLVCLLISLTSSHKARWIAAGPVLASIFLSGVRTAWLGLGVAWLYFVARLRGRTRFRIIAVSIIFIVLGVPLLTIGPIADKVGERITSFSQLSNDGSYQARTMLYENMTAHLLQSFVGSGLGATGLATKLNNEGSLGEFGTFDSGVLEIPFTLGWPGGIAYFSGVIWVLLMGMAKTARAEQTWNVACDGIILGTFSQLISGNCLVGGVGMLFWCFLGLSFAQRTQERVLLLHSCTLQGARKPDEPKAPFVSRLPFE